MRRRARQLVTAGILGLLVLPVGLDRDGLPLSTYPMYSRARPSEVGFATAFGLDASGDRVTLGLDVIGRSDDPLVVAGELRAAIRAGRADVRCREIAGRLAAPDADRGAPVAVEIVTIRHDVIGFVERDGDVEPVSETVHHRCEVDEAGRG